jgi:hypothetical protein
MSETPFPPFNPNPSPPIAPEQPAARKTRWSPLKEAISKNAETDRAVAAQPDKVPRQKRKKANGDKPSLKFDLQTILRAASGLNEDDLATFEKIVGLLSEAGKPGRERLLAAVAKIFA